MLCLSERVNSDVENSIPEVEEQSKDKIASRLNLLLSQKPEVPPGRRVLRSSECSSNEASPVPVLVHPNNHTSSSIKYASIDMSQLVEDRNSLSSEISNCISSNLPESRQSIVSASSNGSSDGYIKPGDIASVPPPLPARRNISTLPPSRSAWKHPLPAITTVPSYLLEGDSRSYLDLNCDIEDEPLYVSSHFANEPLYQIYTANVLERATMNQGDYSSEDDYEVSTETEAIINEF